VGLSCPKSPFIHYEMMPRELLKDPGYDTADGRLIRSAQYVRMSTEHQKYSTTNQIAGIAEYATRHGMIVVRTYVDEGRSGLSVDGRAALQRLLRDVTEGRADFSCILVLDVSRWGRFQDVDEAAYLEYLCRRAGIEIRYCAEPFDNDGSLASSIVKTLKRAMAGEYSRELSAKVFAGQAHLISLGYRQGGPAGFGLRRMVISEQGHHKGELQRGEHKSLQTDRVVLIPGPPDEVAVVRRIYGWFADQGLNERAIADALNREGVKTDLGRVWTPKSIRQLLTNEKYIGNNVFNRHSAKLHGRRVRNPAELVIRARRVFPAIVDPDLFARAQGRIARRAPRYSETELLQNLQDLLSKTGYLSTQLIDDSDEMPSAEAYARRFGSLINAYRRVGYREYSDYSRLKTRPARRQLTQDLSLQLCQAVVQTGGTAHFDRNSRLVVVDSGLKVAIHVAAPSSGIGRGQHWDIRFRREVRPDFTIVARLADAAETIRDYFILPRLVFPSRRLILREENPFPLAGFQALSLDAFVAMLVPSDPRSAP